MSYSVHFFKLLKIHFICVYRSFACMYVCMPDAGGGQTGTLDPLGLELQTAVRHHVGAINQTSVPGKGS